ncbi:hypothetical protein M0R45_001059 [Rubus argutus]|uniref:Uncharacterized protein n=1 Tax=Rubus argutus TaxID=59490 RepID=A0AAW1VL70_RUBAR
MSTGSSRLEWRSTAVGPNSDGVEGRRGGILIAGGGAEMTGDRGHGIPSSASWAWHGQRRLERSKLGSLADSGAVERGGGLVTSVRARCHERSTAKGGLGSVASRPRGVDRRRARAHRLILAMRARGAGDWLIG